MIEKENIDRMQQAYRYLYEIENYLRIFIQKRMSQEYGDNWYYVAPRIKKRKIPRKPYTKLSLHELVTFLRVYPCFNFSTDEILQIQSVFPIRNKIAHCQSLSDAQFQEMKKAHQVIKRSAIVDE